MDGTASGFICAADDSWMCSSTAGGPPEAAFQAFYARSCLRTDRFMLTSGCCMYLAVLLRPLAIRDWAAAAATLAQAAWNYGLLRITHRRCYPRLRSWVLGTKFICHILVNYMLAPAASSPSCHLGPWRYWLSELTMAAFLWTALVMLVFPLPLLHALLACTAAAGVSLCLLGARFAGAVSRCKLAGQRYTQAAQLVRAAASWFAPPTWDWQQALPARDSFFLVHTVMHAAALLLVLAVLDSWEQAGRAAFARQWRPPRQAPARRAAEPCSHAGMLREGLVLLLIATLVVCSILFL
ncbi:hypothetical protein ABPG75_006782 [Micractinium tetrahymenae]